MSESTLPGRTIESAPYTGLLERLNQIAAVSGIVVESPDSFGREDLLNMVAQIGELATEAVVFSGATQEEAEASFRIAIGGLTFGKAEH
ncbi:hypothetical protein IWC96_06935 [Brevundimonas sp. BAL450]|nr:MULTISPECIES: hypothetical protein [Brevundimonas]MBG7615016.1 hypothetical protein [Brevundimonas sp. BAL450]